MDIKVAAYVDKLIFKLDQHRHTVYQARESEKLASREDWRGTFKAVLAETLDDAVDKLRVEVYAFLRGRNDTWGDAPLKDFYFTIRYEDVHDGYFYCVQNFTNMPCEDYPVVLDV